MDLQKHTPYKTFKIYLLLYAGIVLYSLTTVANKVAAGYSVLSLKWLVFYGAGIILLGIYALVWQQVLKKLPLTTAYANRAAVPLLGLFWGAVLFGEKVSLRAAIGAVIIVAGILVVARAENGTE